MRHAWREHISGRADIERGTQSIEPYGILAQELGSEGGT